MELLVMAETYGLEPLLKLQDGLITRGQALAIGWSTRQIDRWVYRESWKRLLPNVYQVWSSKGLTQPEICRVRIRAAWLWAGETSTIAMESAAWWLGLDARPPAHVEVWVQPSHRKTAQEGVKVRRRLISESDTANVDGILVTSKSRTAIDLSAAGSTDGLDTLARKRQLDAVRLDRCLMRGSGSRGWVAAREAVAESSSNPWSPVEREFHLGLRAAGINDWIANSPIKVGTRQRVPDVRLRDVPLLIEIDGKQFHHSDAAFEADSERDSEYTAAGWTALRFTGHQVRTRPRWVIATVLATRARLVGHPIPIH